MKNIWQILLALALSAAPSAVQAQFNYAASSAPPYTVTITASPGLVGAITIPATINGLPVAAVGPYAFVGSELTSITIPGSVASIGVSAFSGRVGLTNVTISYGVASIRTTAFYNCSSLPVIILPKSITNVESEAFAFCASMTNVYFQGNPPNVGSSVFLDDNATGYCPTDATGWSSPFAGIPVIVENPCHCATNADNTLTITNYNGTGGVMIIPSSLNGAVITAIGKNAFARSAVSYVVIPTSVNNIGDLAFYHCSSLASLSIPSGVTNIGADAFALCSSLSNVSLPSSLTTLQSQVFADTGLTDVTIPASITNFADDAFDGSATLTGILFEGDAPNLVTNPPTESPPANATIFYLPGAAGWSYTFDGVPTALWNPLIQTGDGSFGLRNKQFGFNITGTPDIPVAVETCSNLINPVWTPIQTLTLTGGSVYFSDPQWKKTSCQYYRMRFP